MKKETKKVWITRWALTKGIIVGNAEIHDDGVLVPQLCYAPNGFWHDNEAAALRHAEELRARKIKNLKKSIKRVEDKTIKIVPASEESLRNRNGY